MSKVFNKKRIESIKYGKVKKYLLYAIGEILIVAIGIFLAIYMNGLKEDNVNQKYVRQVMDDVEAEAKKYITNSIFFMQYNAKRDTLVQKILTNSVEMSDYNLTGDVHLNVLQTMVDFNFDNTHFENLNSRIDFLSEDEKKVYDLLSVIKTNQGGYEFIGENAVKILNEYKRFQKENHDWFYQIEEDSIATQKEFDYRLGSFEFKNFISDYASYEINFKSNSYTFFQAVSFIVLFRVLQARDNKKMGPQQMDSLFTSLNFEKIPLLNCDTPIEKESVSVELFKNLDLYNFTYNGSEETIVIKDMEDKVLT
ncbi:MAG: hypothetical protein AAFN93_10860, partial [Bacteroidota bacterium]